MFHKNIIKNNTNLVHKNYDATMSQLCSTYFNSNGKKIHTLPRCSLITIQSGTFYVPLAFGVVLFAMVCFFLPMQFWTAVDFTLALWYPNFKLQYLMNYSSSSNFNTVYRFQLQLQAICTTLLYIVIGMPEFWSLNYYSPISIYKQCFMKTQIKPQELRRNN